jgi:hypothetical protein
MRNSIRLKAAVVARMTSWTERDRIRFEPRAKKFGGAVVSLRHGSPAVILRLDRRIQYSRALAAEHKRSGEYWITRWSLSSGSPKARPGGG